jgi:hypothetical protein
MYLSVIQFVWMYLENFISSLSDLLINLQLKNISVFVDLLELSQIVDLIYLMYCFIYIIAYHTNGDSMYDVTTSVV